MNVARLTSSISTKRTVRREEKNNKVKSCISEKEILDIAWKYFQQHASQRISYFNFFVLFSSFMTTGLITTFHPQFRAHAVGVAIGFMQVFLSFIFWKVDERNKFLTRIGENAIKEIEKKYELEGCCQHNPHPIQMFLHEVAQTENVLNDQKNVPFLKKQISHSKSFNMIFVVYAFVGFCGACFAIYSHYNPPSLMQSNSINFSGNLPASARISVFVNSSSLRGATPDKTSVVEKRSISANSTSINRTTTTKTKILPGKYSCPQPSKEVCPQPPKVVCP
ncbi:hypothetical protein [Oryzomonas rubra]|uniref:Uncharacterized protein n=1 Tax=Oryzomonas rubra TaxID=2509454 RepID=A0A5A9XIU7_9BACT|nr:hypothetical protein [Oryzomonas rubra]KAA0891611.1 hypothetical protein ET418_09165 [Oryzomonas rubra]